MSKLVRIAVCLLCVNLLTVPHHAYSQSTGNMRGQVCAKNGPGIANATVTAKDDQTGQTFNATTNDSGHYHLSNLPVGTYTVTFQGSGFQKGVRKNVKIVTNQTTECNHLEMIFQTSDGRGLSGHELLAVTRVAHGGGEYAGLQYVTARAEGFINASAFASAGAPSMTGAVEVKVGLADYQDRDMRRRLDISPMGAMATLGGGPTFLVYTGTQGGGMLLGNEIRVSEVAASRQWAMMGFATLNRAIEGQLATARQRDEGNYYVVEVKFNSEDTVRFWINKNTFLIDKVVTRYKSQVMIEEDRSDYRKVSCMTLPFRIVTRLRGQRLADLTINNYDLQTVVPNAQFTMTAMP